MAPKPIKTEPSRVFLHEDLYKGRKSFFRLNLAVIQSSYSFVTDTPDFYRVVGNYTPEESFDYAWVSALLEQVLEDVETACYEEGMTVHWCVFRERILTPITEGTDPAPLAEICHKYDIENPRMASNMIITVKRRFQSILRKQVRQTVLSGQAVEEELKEILKFFKK